MSDRVLIARSCGWGTRTTISTSRDALRSPRVYLDLLNDLAENLIAHGFRRIVFINGHGGNITPGKQPSSRSGSGTRPERSAAAVRVLLGQRNPNAGRPDLVQSQMGHAASGRRR